jgi:hypothetical protein
METRSQMKKTDKIEIAFYAGIYVLVIIFLVFNQGIVDEFIEHGNEKAKYCVNIVSVAISVIIAFRLKNLYHKNKS